MVGCNLSHECGMMYMDGRTKLKADQQCVDQVAFTTNLKTLKQLPRSGCLVEGLFLCTFQTARGFHCWLFINRNEKVLHFNIFQQPYATQWNRLGYLIKKQTINISPYVENPFCVILLFLSCTLKNVFILQVLINKVLGVHEY